MKRAEDDDDGSIRITQQFRARESLVYDLRGKSGRLTLRCSGRGGADDGPPAEWCFEACTGTSPDSAVATAWASTRVEALRAVGREWGEKRIALGLPLFDWASIERAMSAVRAV